MDNLITSSVGVSHEVDFYFNFIKRYAILIVLKDKHLVHYTSTLTIMLQMRVPTNNHSCHFELSLDTDYLMTLN